MNGAVQEGVRLFRKKSVDVEAVRYVQHRHDELRRWSEGAIIVSSVLETTDDNPSGEYVQIRQPYGETITAVPGEWIIRDWQGCFHVMSDWAFSVTYEPVPTPEAPDA